jgi:hypothetical protein
LVGAEDLVFGVRPGVRLVVGVLVAAYWSALSLVDIRVWTAVFVDGGRLAETWQ